MSSISIRLSLHHVIRRTGVFSNKSKPGCLPGFYSEKLIVRLIIQCSTQISRGHSKIHQKKFLSKFCSKFLLCSPFANFHRWIDLETFVSWCSVSKSFKDLLQESIQELPFWVVPSGISVVTLRKFPNLHYLTLSANQLVCLSICSFVVSFLFCFLPRFLFWFSFWY